jgi:DNA modification methylase
MAAKAITIGSNTLYQGNCLKVLKQLPDESVHMVVTSPPYWGLRDYSTGMWQGGDPKCSHKTIRDSSPKNPAAGMRHASSRWECSCGATRTDEQIGLEETPNDYVAALVAVFREVKRVLRRDGVVFLNLGDSYAGSGEGKTGGQGSTSQRKGRANVDKQKRAGRVKWRANTGQGCYLDGGKETIKHTNRNGIGAVSNLPAKNLVGIPWRVAFALQADGWILRQDIIWSKSNSMPESVTDRCSKAHEYIFLLAKSPRYYFDYMVIRTPATPAERVVTGKCGSLGQAIGKGVKPSGNGIPGSVIRTGDAANKRSVWNIPTVSFKGSHFAVFPPMLVKPCILAGTSQKGCCPKCGAPWRRKLKKKRKATRPALNSKVLEKRKLNNTPGRSPTSSLPTLGSVVGNRDPLRHCTEVRTVGWEPSCSCDAGDPIPCIVLDPFAGACTVGVVAQAYGRKFIGIELNPEYLQMAASRLRQRGRYDPPAKQKVGFFA